MEWCHIYGSVLGLVYKYMMWKCKYCISEFSFEKTAEKANHTRWCKDNPDAISIRKQASKNTKNATLASTGRVVSIDTREKLRDRMLGRYVGEENHFYGKTHTEESRKKISEAALNSKHRRLVRSVREYRRIDGYIVLLDSSWEEILAIRLDEQGIKWSRPTLPIEWIDKTNKKRHYFPDFYLEDFGIFLDPKNKAAMSAQQEKVDWLLENRKDIYFLTTLQECKDYTLAFV